jgi:hypothetical protein
MRGAMEGAGGASKALAWGELLKAEAARCDRWWSTAAGVVAVGEAMVAEVTVAVATVVETTVGEVTGAGVMVV